MTRNVSAEPQTAPDTILHFQTPSRIVTDGGTDLRLPPGYFLDEGRWDVLDIEMKRLQDQETRLRAENESLRNSADDFSLGWLALSSIAVSAFGAGVAYAAWRD